MNRFLFAVILGLAGCSAAHEPEHLPADAVRLDPSWEPVEWLEGDVVLFKSPDAFLTYDLRKRAEASRVRTGPVAIQCVDADAGEVHFARTEGNGNSVQYKYGDFLDLSSMTVRHLPDEVSIGNGPFNCPHFLNYKAGERRMKHEKLHAEYLGESWQTYSDSDFSFFNLLHRSDGGLYALDKGNMWDDSTRLLYLDRAGKVSYYPVANSRFRIEYSAAHDAATRKYLVYQQTSDFDQTKGPWPLAAYLLDLDTVKFREKQIPAGPWVVPYGFFDQLKGFSCGISCYTHMRMHLVGDRVLISVWGRLVDPNTRGLYLLEDDRWSLLKHYDGEEPPVIVNGRDGCRVAVHQGRDTLLADICTIAKRR